MLYPIKTALISVLFTSIQFVAGQSLPIIKPAKSVNSNTYSKADQIFWRKGLDQYKETESGELTYAALPDTDKKVIDSLEEGYGPITEGPGCSWYCGGGPYLIDASSSLKTDGINTYVADNCHDFNLFTAWAPDTKTGIIGARLNFYFKSFSPRVHTIKIYNGYLKNKDLWLANGRAKKLKLLINNEPKAILDLEDVTAAQSFKIDTVQSTDMSKDLVITLEILEVYKGSKYDDLAISEINFDGLDVHCFASGTKITMADNSEQEIQNIHCGDRVLSYDIETNQWIQREVSECVTARHNNLVELQFEHVTITTTDDHPFFNEINMWSSVNPDKSNVNYIHETPVTKLLPGMRVTFFDSKKKTFSTLIDIRKIKEEQLTYTLMLIDGDTFIANGLLVKTETPFNSARSSNFTISLLPSHVK